MSKIEQNYIKNAEINVTNSGSDVSLEQLSKNLLIIDGIISIDADIDKKKICIKYYTKKVKLKNIIKVIQSFKYDVKNDKVVLTIGDMNCFGCTGVIKNSLNLLDGVIDVIIDFGTHKATIIYNPSLTSLMDMKKAIQHAGHQYIANIEGENISDNDLDGIIEKRENSLCDYLY